MDCRTPLRRILDEQGLSQAELARRVGIQKADMSRIANRGMHPTQDEARRIAAELSRHPAEIFGAGYSLEFDEESVA